MTNGLIVLLWQGMIKPKGNLTEYQTKLMQEIDFQLTLNKAKVYKGIYWEIYLLNFINKVFNFIGHLFLMYLFYCIATELPRLLIFYIEYWSYLKIILILFVIRIFYGKYLLKRCTKHLEELKEQAFDGKLLVRQCLNDLSIYKDLRIFHYLEKNQNNLFGLYLLRYIYLAVSEKTLKKTEELFEI